MSIKKLLVGAAASVAMSLGLVAGAYAAPVVNGSFETGINPGVFTQLLAGNSTGIASWTVVSGSVDYIGSYWVSSDGNRSLDMTGSNGQPGAVSQTFVTVAGHNYVVTFDLAGNPFCGNPVKNLRVDAGGEPVNYTFDTTGKTLANMGWITETFEFTATGSSTTLTFASLDSGFCGPALDNVVVSDVLTDKNQCKNDGWMAYTAPAFKNQGDCVSYITSTPNAVGNHNQ